MHKLPKAELAALMAIFSTCVVNSNCTASTPTANNDSLKIAEGTGTGSSGKDSKCASGSCGAAQTKKHTKKKGKDAACKSAESKGKDSSSKSSETNSNTK